MDPLFYQAQIDNLKAELAELRLALRLLVPVGGERMSPYSQFLQALDELDGLAKAPEVPEPNYFS